MLVNAHVILTSEHADINMYLYIILKLQNVSDKIQIVAQENIWRHEARSNRNIKFGAPVNLILLSSIYYI